LNQALYAALSRGVYFGGLALNRGTSVSSILTSRRSILIAKECGSRHSGKEFAIGS
jgi:hypothetical protein